MGFLSKTETKTIDVLGMTCGHCVARVEESLSKVPGIKKVVVSLEGKTATFQIDPKKASADDAVKAVEAIGYSAKKRE